MFLSIFKIKCAFFSFLILFSIIYSAHSNPLCFTNSDCQELSDAGVKTRTQESEAELMPLFLNVSKEIGGHPYYMSKIDAISYCNSRGARLPKAREFAMFAMILGAKGIAEVSGGKPDNSYDLVIAIDGNKRDHFYFSEEGYQGPGSFKANYSLWLSSVDDSGFSLTFKNLSGSIDGSYGFTNPVRCVKDR